MYLFIMSSIHNIMNRLRILYTAFFIVLIIGATYFLYKKVNGSKSVDFDGTLSGIDANVKADVSEGESGFIKVPLFLSRNFKKTDFSNANPKIEKILSGGPGKDGIPALFNPRFESLNNSDINDDVQVIVLQAENEIKLYPYNILVWHEIVNDKIGELSVAVTFCPLCGTAIVFDRKIEGEVLSFGVSGALIESNMVMYDKNTESLWQQSTGESLAGAHVGNILKIVPMQLISAGKARDLFPDAKILSKDTGYARDYNRNPYGGYDEIQDRLYFPVSEFGSKYPAKEIMIVFRLDDNSVAIPMKNVIEGEFLSEKVGGKEILITKTEGEVSIEDSRGMNVPFYFEMWFSFSVQHGKNAIVL